ncbi:hypothetical protein SDC9_73187 [bioreactor metagenome]|uniref:Uncharacterized protein n=1 Tax=bioreactor metagenome TaxID=1076179 RepID=A0A644YJL3_9ZZZZ
MASNLPRTPKPFKQAGGDIPSNAAMSICMHDKKFSHGIIIVCMHDEIVGVKEDKTRPLLVHRNKKGVIPLFGPIR